LLLIDRGLRLAAVLVLLTCEIDNELFSGDKILHLESDFRKLGSVAVLRSLTILRTSLAQTDTEKAEKYVKIIGPEIRQTIYSKAAKFRSQYNIGGSNPVPASGL